VQDGLQLAPSLNFDSLEVELDAEIVVNSNLFGTIVKYQEMPDESNFTIQTLHCVYYEAKKCANAQKNNIDALKICHL
jgi:hypothetical protein